MGKIEDILRRVENNEATDEEMTMAEEHLRGFEQRLSSQVDVWEASEASASAPRRVRMGWMQHAAAAAAILLLLFSIALWQEHSDTPSETAMAQKDTFDNPEEAAAEAETALLKFSEAINKATCYNTK